MKRFLSVVVMFIVVTLLFTACSSNSTSIATLPENTAEQLLQEESQAAMLIDSTPMPATSYPTQQQKFTIKNNDSYTVEVSIELGGWIKASDQTFLDGAWSALGGDIDSSGYMSLMNIFTDNDIDFHTDHSTIAFGRVSFRNTTPNFSATSDRPLSPSVWITTYTADMGYKAEFHSKGSNSMTMGAWLANGSGLQNMFWAYSTHEITAKMSRDTWGPVLVAFSLNKVFTPNHPNGNPDISDATIWFEGSGHGQNTWIRETEPVIFTPEKTW